MLQLATPGEGRCKAADSPSGVTDNFGPCHATTDSKASVVSRSAGQRVRAQNQEGCSVAHTLQSVTNTQDCLALLYCPLDGHQGCSVNTQSAVIQSKDAKTKGTGTGSQDCKGMHTAGLRVCLPQCRNPAAAATACVGGRRKVWARQGRGCLCHVPANQGLGAGLTPANTQTSITLTLCDAARARVLASNNSVLITNARSPHRPNNKQCV